MGGKSVEPDSEKIRTYSRASTLSLEKDKGFPPPIRHRQYFVINTTKMD